MLAEEDEVNDDIPELNQKVLDIELVNGTGLYSAVRGDEMIFVEFAVGNFKVTSMKRTNTLHPLWNETLKLQFDPVSGKPIDLQIKVFVDIEGRYVEVATRKLKDLQKTLTESVPFNALDYKFGKEKRLTFALTALNFGMTTKEMTQARVLSRVAHEFSKYITHLYVLLQIVESVGSEEKLEKLRQDLDFEKYLVEKKRINLEDFQLLDSEIGFLKKVLNEVEYDPSQKMTKEIAGKIKNGIEGDSILFEMFKNFTESMKSTPHSSTKKKKNRNYVRSFIKGVRKRGKRLSKFKRSHSNGPFSYSGNLRFIFPEEISITQRQSDNKSRGKWKGIDVMIITHPTADGKNIETQYIKLQLFAKLSQDLPIPHIYGVVGGPDQVPVSPSTSNRTSMNDLKVGRLKNEMCLLVDDEPDYNLDDFLSEAQGLSTETRIKLVMDIMEALRMLHQDDFRHGYLTLKSIFFRVKSVKKKKKSIIDPKIHPLILGRCFYSLIDQAISKPIPREEVGYLSPEVVQEQFSEGKVPTYTEESDVFSFGICAFQILGGKLQRVYHRQYGKQPQKTLDYAFPKSFDETPIMNQNPWIKDVLGKCLSFDPSKRPSMRKVLRRFKDELQKERGPSIFYCRSIDEDDADAEEMTLSEFSMKQLRLTIKKRFGENSVVDSIFEMTDSGHLKPLTWNQDVYELRPNAMVVVKFAPEGTIIRYPDEEEEEYEASRKLSENNKKNSIRFSGGLEVPEKLKKIDDDDNNNGPKLANQFAEDSENDDDASDDIEDEEEYSMSDDDEDREPIVFYLRSENEDDDDADDYLMNDFTMNELKSLIYKERGDGFIKLITVKKDDDSVHKLSTDLDLRRFMDEDDMVIVKFGKDGEKPSQYGEIETKKKDNNEKKKTTTTTNNNNNNDNNVDGMKKEDIIEKGEEVENKLIMLTEENIKLKEELSRYKNKCLMLEKKVEELSRMTSTQKKEIGYMKLNMFKEF